MRPAQHLEKARRVVRSLDKLDAAGDSFAIIDGALIAGYHLGNALLHAHGVSAPAVHFNTPSKLEQPIDTLPAAAQPAFRSFGELEALRSVYVRGPAPPDERAAQEARRALAEMVRHCAALSTHSSDEA